MKTNGYNNEYHIKRIKKRPLRTVNDDLETTIKRGNGKCQCGGSQKAVLELPIPTKFKKPSLNDLINLISNTKVKTGRGRKSRL